MRRVVLIAPLLLLSACAVPADITTGAAVYSATAIAADPPPDAATAAHNIAKNVHAGAAEAMGHVNNFGQAAKEGFYGDMDRVADWMRPAPPKGPPQAVAASYCYHVLHDILCYRAPMPGWEYRLVAYQGTNAEPPPPATTEPLAMRPLDSSQQPATRVANAQPVFVSPPPAIENSDSDQPQTQAVTPPDPTHQQLPDPALAPQL